MRKDIAPPFTGWPKRLQAYYWPDPTMGYRETADAMAPWYTSAGNLSRKLQDNGAWTPEERAHATQLAQSMMSWGRVKTPKAFSEHAVEAAFRRALDLDVVALPPMRSSWSKVAALATAFLEGHPRRAPHVIWDSRVSTSLVTRLDTMMSSDADSDPKSVFPGVGPTQGRGGSRAGTPIHKRLHLRWPHVYEKWSGQDAGSQLVRELRDTLNAEGHLMPLPHGGDGPWTIRGVESVLFMDGY